MLTKFSNQYSNYFQDSKLMQKKEFLNKIDSEDKALAIESLKKDSIAKANGFNPLNTNSYYDGEDYDSEEAMSNILNVDEKTSYLHLHLVDVLLKNKQIPYPTALVSCYVQLLIKRHNLLREIYDWPLWNYTILTSTYVPTDGEIEDSKALTSYVRDASFSYERYFVATCVEEFSVASSEEEKLKILSKLATWYKELQLEVYTLKRIVRKVESDSILVIAESSLLVVITIVLYFILALYY